MIGMCNGTSNSTPHEEIAFCLCKNIEEGREVTDYCPMCRMLKDCKDQLEALAETVERLMSDRR